MVSIVLFQLEGTQTTVLILADSQLAICTTTGAWAARSNRTLVNKNKRALARLRGKGIDVRFRHIRAHEGHRMNERADALAKQGGQGLRQREGSYYRPPLPPSPPSLLPVSQESHTRRDEDGLG